MELSVAPAYVVDVETHFGLAHEKAVFHGRAYPANLRFETSLPFGVSSNDTFSVRATSDGATAPARRLARHLAGIVLSDRRRLGRPDHHGQRRSCPDPPLARKAR